LELTPCVRKRTFRGRGVGSPSLASTCGTQREEGCAVIWCDRGGCWVSGRFDADIPPRVRPCSCARDAEWGGKAGERGRFGEKARCKRASESFGFDDVGLGVSGSDEEDVDCSE
jgi:hypothetical protein